MYELSFMSKDSMRQCLLSCLNVILFDELRKVFKGTDRLKSFYEPYKTSIHKELNNTMFPLFIAGVNKNKTTAASKISHHLATFGSSVEDSQKQIETSGFSTKDSSDSKSHDSGIDSIEKPGKYWTILPKCHHFQ